MRGCANLSPRNACEATAIMNESEKLTESMVTSVMPAEESTRPTNVTAADTPAPYNGPDDATSSKAERLGANPRMRVMPPKEPMKPNPAGTISGR